MSLSRNESGRFGALKSDSTRHFFRNACTKSGSLRFSVFRLLTNFVCLYTYEFWLSLCKIVRNSVILLLPLFITGFVIRIAFYDFRVKTLFISPLLLLDLYDVHVSLSVLLYVCWWPVRFIHQIITIWCTCHLAVTRRVILIEKELLALPEHPRSLSVLSAIGVSHSSVATIVCPFFF